MYLGDLYCSEEHSEGSGAWQAEQGATQPSTTQEQEEVRNLLSPKTWRKAFSTP